MDYKTIFKQLILDAQQAATPVIKPRTYSVPAGPGQGRGPHRSPA